MWYQQSYAIVSQTLVADGTSLRDFWAEMNKSCFDQTNILKLLIHSQIDVFNETIFFYFTFILYLSTSSVDVLLFILFLIICLNK